MRGSEPSKTFQNRGVANGNWLHRHVKLLSERVAVRGRARRAVTACWSNSHRAFKNRSAKRSNARPLRHYSCSKNNGSISGTANNHKSVSLLILSLLAHNSFSPPPYWLVTSLDIFSSKRNETLIHISCQQVGDHYGIRSSELDVYLKGFQEFQSWLIEFNYLYI